VALFFSGFQLKRRQAGLYAGCGTLTADPIEEKPLFKGKTFVVFALPGENAAAPDDVK
jgi:peroxiredoxin